MVPQGHPRRARGVLAPGHARRGPGYFVFQPAPGHRGRHETGLHVKNLLDALDYDIEAHVRAVLGGAATPLLALIHRR